MNTSKPTTKVSGKLVKIFYNAVRISKIPNGTVKARMTGISTQMANSQ